jgi:hypothetical protein
MPNSGAKRLIIKYFHINLLKNEFLLTPYVLPATFYKGLHLFVITLAENVIMDAVMSVRNQEN